MTNSNPLDFLVIGAQKAATSWLYNCLSEHPELHLPKRKREVEYLGGALHQQHGSDWYFSLMAGGTTGQLRGDVSIEYLFDRNSPNAVREHLARVKLIASLRDPVERAISAFYWGTRKGYLAASNLDDGLQRAMDAYTSEDEDRPTKTRDKYAEIIKRGLYAEQIDRFRARFPAEDFCILFYDDITESPHGVIEQVYSFLGVNSAFVPRAIARRPKRNTYHRALIHLERLAPKARLLAGLLDRVNTRLAPSQPVKPELNPLLMDSMRAFFAPHNAKLRILLDEMTAGGTRLSGETYPSWL